MNRQIKKSQVSRAAIAALGLCLAGTPVEGGTGVNDAYLESTGREYIMTGVRPTSKTRIVVDYQRNAGAQSGGEMIAGFDLNTAQVAIGRVLVSNAPQFFVRCCNGSCSWQRQSFAIDDLERHTVEVALDGSEVIVDGQKMTVDPALINGFGDAAAGIDIRGGISLFACNEKCANGTVKYGISAKLYGCRIYEDGKLVRDFVPYSSAGHPGLLDRVDAVFYENDSGAGQFTLVGEEKKRTPLKSDDWKLFRYESTVTFKECGIAAGNPVTNIPVLLRLGPGSPEGFSIADCPQEAEDMAFASCSNGEWLDFDIDAWDREGGSCAVWVRVPSLSEKTAIKAYWKRKSYEIALCDTHCATWTNAQYAAVMHMSRRSFSSSTNGLDAAGANGFTTAGSASSMLDAGPVGDCLRSTSAKYSISLPRTGSSPWASTLSSSDYTLAFWVNVNPAESGSWPYFVNWTLDSASDGDGFWLGGTLDTSNADTHGNTVYFRANGQCSAGKSYFEGDWRSDWTYVTNWLHYTMVVHCENGMMKGDVYYNGVLVRSLQQEIARGKQTFISDPNNSDGLRLLVGQVGWAAGDVKMDEFRISTVARDPAYVAASYRMMVDPVFAKFAPRSKAHAPVSRGLVISFR